MRKQRVAAIAITQRNMHGDPPDGRIAPVRGIEPHRKPTGPNAERALTSIDTRPSLRARNAAP